LQTKCDIEQFLGLRSPLAGERDTYQSAAAGDVIPLARKELRETDDDAKPEVISASEIFDAAAEISENYPLGGTADSTVKRWFSSFPEENKSSGH
jgi:hypothetical protein